MSRRIAGILLAALLAAPGSAHLLAQQREPELASTAAGAQRAAPLRLAAAISSLPETGPALESGRLRQYAPGTVLRDCAECPEMVVIPQLDLSADLPGIEAIQADPELERHQAEKANAIAIGRYEITRGQFARFVQDTGHVTDTGCFVWNGSRYLQDASKGWRNPGFAQTDDDPVVCVNWGDAKAYADWLTKKTRNPYRLPTEIEWEYAARAGVLSQQPWGEDAADACRYANVADASAKRDVPGIAARWAFYQCSDDHAYTAPVGSYLPNAYGLYDMLGNVWEWTEDCYDDELLGTLSGDEARQGGSCSQRVLRGGSWVDSPAYVSYDFRFFIRSGDRDFYAGFRVSRTD